MQRKKLWEKLKLLNPKNLEKEVDMYGYHFSWKSHMLLILGTMMGISVIGMVFQVKPVFFAMIVGALICALPVLVADMYKKMYEQKRFADATTYMEQMLYSFQKTGKVISALKESREIFQEGQMRQTIEQAISHIEKGNTKTERGIIRESLSVIERQYNCVKIHMVHELLAGTEEYGGETENAVLILLEDIENWKKRGYRLQAEKKKSHRDTMISIIVATILCAVALYVLDEMKIMLASEHPVEIFQIPLIQVSSALFILYQLHVFVKSARNLTNDWLTEEWEQDSSYIEKSYRLIMQYDKKREKRKSFWMGFPFVLLLAVFFVLGKPQISLVCFGLMMFFFLQHKTGYYIAKKDVTEALYQVLPQWLMEMALLLQNNNVQVSLAKSTQSAAGILKKELILLQERLHREPEKLCAYTAFCEKFDLPEVASCMKMLHAVSENGTGNVNAQMSHLLERVHQMQNQADDIQNEKIAFRMKLMFSYPVVAATAKLLLDLTMGMFVMFQLLVGMGGVQ